MRKNLQSSRNAGIDLLRGLAIVLVITHHLGLRLPLNKSLLASFAPKWILGTLNWRGYQAVFLFFAISGFLIARNLLNRWERLSQIQPLAFYRRRSARILPCLLALLAVLSVLHFLHLKDFTIEEPGQSLGHALFSALGLHLNWYEGITGYLPANWDVLWSLSIEECFYLAFPIVCLLLRWDLRLCARNWKIDHLAGILRFSEFGYTHSHEGE
jgi:peptidoglycan/LPS O-acetylase OafA/YrhL